MFDKRIVLLHSIDDKNYSSKRLIRYVKYMRLLGYKFVTVEEILSEKCRGRYIALTVDDAYLTCTTNLIPVLDKYKIPALLFVPTGFLGLPANHPLLLEHKCYKDCAIMSVDDINFWISKGYQVGFHTHYHIDLYRADDDMLSGKILKRVWQ